MLIGVNEYKVLELFFKFPEKKFHLRELARLTGLSAPGVMNIVEQLRQKNLLEVEKTKVVSQVSVKRGKEFILLKRFHNLLSLHECGLVDFLEKTFEEPEAVIVFGSFSRGEDLSDSDIDLAVVTNLEKKLDFKKFEKSLHRKLALHEISLSKCTKEFLNNLSNGIVLSGYLRLLK